MSDGLDSNDLAFPPFIQSLGLNISTIPEVNLHFLFDGLELYMLADTILSSGVTYTLSLYRSESALGVEITKNLNLGIIFEIDLILEVDATIDISSGFHIKVENGLAIDIAMFCDDVSCITL